MRGFLPKVNVMACEYSHDSHAEEAKYGWGKLDKLNSGAVTAKTGQKHNNKKKNLIGS